MNGVWTTRAVPACPACGDSVFTVLGTTDNGHAALAYELRRCARCDLFYKSRRADETVLAEFYGSFDFNVHETPGLLPPERIVDTGFRALPMNSRLLDYGCCAGRFLSRYVGVHECWGVEPNPTAAAQAAERGLRMVSDAALSELGPYFDAILLSDVFEHLTEPTVTLRRLAGSLRPGGRLVLLTGWADAIQPDDDAHAAEFWYLQIPWHLHMLSARHLRWLADELDLEIAGWERCGHYDQSRFKRGKQRVRRWAFSQFHDFPRRRWLHALLRRTPHLKMAAAWPARPAVYLPDDHVVASLAKAAPTAT